jgi:hypothetical protein
MLSVKSNFIPDYGRVKSKFLANLHQIFWQNWFQLFAMASTKSLLPATNAPARLELFVTILFRSCLIDKNINYRLAD